MTASEGRIFKLLARGAWEAASTDGRFLGSPVDVADGFIHFSTADQLEETVRRHFRNQDDLVCLEVETIDLGDLRWEPSRGGALFPHLYGAMETAKVARVWTMRLDPDGVPVRDLDAP